MRILAGMTRKYLKTKTVAEYLDMKESGVRRLIRLGELRAIDIGTSTRHVYRVDEAELVRYTEKAQVA